MEEKKEDTMMKMNTIVIKKENKTFYFIKY